MTNEILEFCTDNDIDIDEVNDSIEIDSNDFEVDGYRFILKLDIDEIQLQELSNDEYILGCFNASFLESIIDWPIEAIEATQEAEKYEVIGRFIIQNAGMLQTLQAEYSAIDGYGHHFAHYDGEENEAGDYYVFRVY